MSHSAEQNRKKAEAMADAHHHNMHSTVDGERSRANHMSHLAHLPMRNPASEEKMEGGKY